MNDSEDDFDSVLFRETSGFFSNIVDVFAIQKMANDLMGCEISLCFPKKNGKHAMFYFALHLSNSISAEALVDFGRQLACLLKYDAITVLKKDILEEDFSCVLQISPNNFHKIWRALKKESNACSYKTFGLLSRGNEDVHQTPHKKHKPIVDTPPSEMKKLTNYS